MSFHLTVQIVTVVCEGTNLTISCGPDQIIKILRVSWGRDSYDVCPCPCQGNTTSDQLVMEVMPDNTLRVMKQMCGGKQTCESVIKSSTFGDQTSPSIHKYLQVWHECIPNNLFPKSRGRRDQMKKREYYLPEVRLSFLLVSLTLIFYFCSFFFCFLHGFCHCHCHCHCYCHCHCHCHYHCHCHCYYIDTEQTNRQTDRPTD